MVETTGISLEHPQDVYLVVHYPRIYPRIVERWLSSNPRYFSGRLAPTKIPFLNHQGCFTHLNDSWVVRHQVVDIPVGHGDFPYTCWGTPSYHPFSWDFP